jgi:5-methylcytosine-specific restriction enzyme subunit McrC
MRATEVEAFDRIEDLFASLLLIAASDIRRQGIARGYVEHTEDLRGPKGKLLMAETLKRQLPLRGRVACLFDEWSDDTPVNRIVRSGIRRLVPMASEKIARDLALVETAFSGAGLRPLSLDMFRSLALSPTQRHYAFALDLCALLARWSIPSTEGSQRYAFIDPRTDEQKMGAIFENFVRQYWRAHLRCYQVRPERKLEWGLVGDSEDAAAIVPEMRTDIRLDGPGGLRIVETKFTKETLPGYFGKRSVRPAHLYQLHTYVTHLERAGVGLSQAILLMGGAEPAFEHRYHMDGLEWRIASIDFREPWIEIERRLMFADAPTHGVRSTQPGNGSASRSSA